MPHLDRDLREYVETLVGDQGLQVLSYLEDHDEATDSEIAETLDAKPSHVRKVLYELYAARIAEYHKEKDSETGWLTFYWNLTPGEAAAELQERREEVIGELEEALRFEEEHDFYACPAGGERYQFEDAMELEFHCPDHDVTLDHVEDNENIQVLAKRIQMLRDEAHLETGS